MLHYRFPLIFAAEVLASFVLGRRRDMAGDSRRLLAGLPFQPRVEGQEQIPPEGSCVIVANHYERPGLWVGWGAFLITVTVAERRTARPAVRWVHISEWTRYNFHGLELPTSFTRWLIERASRTWGLLPIPPPGRTDSKEALALLRTARAVTGDNRQALGIFPEGGPSVALRPALPGSGAFLLRLHERGVPLIPVGISEPDGLLTARFGTPIELRVPRDLPLAERDEAAGRQIMVAIARLLPPELWGAYREAPGAETINPQA